LLCSVHNYNSVAMICSWFFGFLFVYCLACGCEFCLIVVVCCVCFGLIFMLFVFVSFCGLVCWWVLGVFIVVWVWLRAFEFSVGLLTVLLFYCV